MTAPSSSLVSWGRSIFSFSSDQIHSTNNKSRATPGSDSEEIGVDAFQTFISDRFGNLSVAEPDELLSLEWIEKLLDAFVLCHDEFRVILSNENFRVSRPSLDRLVSDYFERTVKALDICNAIRDGIGRIQMWEKHLDIVVSALGSQRNTVGEGQLRRARRALTDLTLEMVDGKDFHGAMMRPQRNRSFGNRTFSRLNSGTDQRRPLGHCRSLSWSVSRSWSAHKQLQSISNGCITPRGSEATNGLALTLFSMSFVLLLVLWALVAAIPCKDRGLNINLSIPRHFPWAAPFILLHERILEESKKRERRNPNGLLKEIHRMEKCTWEMTELLESVQCPLTEELRNRVEEGTQELVVVCKVLKNGLDPFEHKLREMFRRIMALRSEGLEFF